MKTLPTRHDALKHRYRKTFEISLILSLLLVFGLLHALPDMGKPISIGSLKSVHIEVNDIVRTYQLKKPPPPILPEVPVPLEREELPPNQKLAQINLELASLPPIPELKDLYDSFSYIPHEIPPRLRGGLIEFHRKIIYPRYALDHGIEGRVVLAVLVDENGRPCKVTVLEDSKEKVGFEEAAMVAVRSCRWYPAEQRDRKVKVWIALPFRFVIDSRTSYWN